jgi:hypothetical protein
VIRAVLDADVLYPLPLRDTLLWAAVEGCFQPLWTDAILEEAIGALMADGRMDAGAASRMRAALTSNFSDAWVEDYQPLMAEMVNHPKDRHVAACATKAGAALIVTSNVKDFRGLPTPIRAISPDEFLCRILKVHQRGCEQRLRTSQHSSRRRR